MSPLSDRDQLGEVPVEVLGLQDHPPTPAQVLGLPELLDSRKAIPVEIGDNPRLVELVDVVREERGVRSKDRFALLVGADVIETEDLAVGLLEHLPPPIR